MDSAKQEGHIIHRVTADGPIDRKSMGRLMTPLNNTPCLQFL
jgi:hypothetical protein